jgi:NADH dehydrogenase
VVIIGAGFAGLEAAKALARAPVAVTVIDRHNHHCFQPLLYQVATAALSPADIAWPIRNILHRQANVRVLMTEVRGIDRAARRVITEGGPFAYEFLIVATGAAHSYFGHPEWAAFAPGLKRVEDALEIRRRILTAFERAELEPDLARRRMLTTFVLVGGGPTGVEMAGAIAEVARNALPADFRNVDPREARVLLVEAGPRILPAFPERLSAYAQRALHHMGVEVLTSAAVVSVDARGVALADRRIDAGLVIWAAGVAASPAADWLGAERDRTGRVKVAPDLSLPGSPEVFVVGDTATVSDARGRPVPGIASAAKQLGRHAGRVVAAQARGRPGRAAFAYKHQGDLATIGRTAAIVHIGRLTLTGFPGWAFWSVAHIYFLIGLRYRLAVAASWLWDYLTFGRRARLITETGAVPPPPRP